MSSLRLAPLACVLLGVLAGCPSEPNTKVCAGTGILCPQEMYCAAVQPICLTTACGNGLIDPGEECDDGNVLPGDNCSPICRKEQCGNNVLDPNEICDDGNTSNGDGCSANCMSKETCGNGIVDVGEACDDGKSAADPNATKNADGCSGTPIMVGTEMSPAPCKSTEVCGNGIKDIQVGEVCDDGNTVSGDGCNSDCRSGEGCGNGILDPGEQCDDGNANNQDDCLNTCKNAKCGDGVVDNMGTHGEQCDPSTTGNPTETMTCNIDCTVRACGDAKVNQTAGEQCDNGVGGNGDTKNCTMGCLLNICGDGKVDMQPPGIEQCDDGNTNNTDGCSNACQLASCGNSTVDVGEQCDDGNTDDTDGCVMCHTAICGDGKTHAGVEQCDDGNTLNGDGCSMGCKNEICGNSILDVNEECDDGNASNTDACTTSCAIAVCGDGFIRAGVEQCDDGNTVSNDGCSSTCRNEGCGNGILDQGEQCDDSNMVSGDGCSSTCQFEACGDGIVNNGEACDGNGTGMGGETASCNSDCTIASCGDGKTNAHRGEQCDAGAGMNADNRDCTAMCKINICTDGLRDTLGPTHFEACDDGNTIPTDGCNNSCTLASCGNGLLDPGEQCDDNNNVMTDSCVNCQNAVCGDGVIHAGVEECDGGPGCSAQCKNQVCGNGIIDPGEQCDDGNLVNGDGCSGNGHPTLTKCKFEFCGDGLKGASETCDKSVASMVGTCNRDCTASSCGDGKLNADSPANEQCDLGSADNGTNQGCSATCQLEHCGDGNVDANEVCDSGASNSVNGPCLTTCQPALCGDGKVQSSSWLSGVFMSGVTGAEQCDDGNTTTETTCAYGLTSCQICNATCQNVTLNSAAATHFCGDGMTDNTGGDTEMCDDGVNNGRTECAYAQTSCNLCSYDCKTVVPGNTHQCGDGKTDGPTEKCDGGSGNNSGPIPATCPYNTTCVQCPTGCASDPVTITGGRCGDGSMQGTEACDNGTANTSDVNCAYGQTSCTKCSTTCTSLTTVVHRCGDSVVEATFNEQCDTANLNSNTCATATGVAGTTGTLLCSNSCDFNTSMCHKCGNGIVEPGEACEPPSTGVCNSSCQIAPFCGNGVVDPGEGCDDTCGGNNCNPSDNGDGCSSTCTVEAGYVCAGAPSNCAMCGNGTCTGGIETDSNCHADCHCGNGICELGGTEMETAGNCSADCMVPAAPTAPMAMNTGATENTISWTASSGATSYKVYFATATGVTTSSMVAGTPSASPLVHMSLTSGMTYFYKIAAVNAVGEGPLSSEVSAMVP